MADTNVSRAKGAVNVLKCAAILEDASPIGFKLPTPYSFAIIATDRPFVFCAEVCVCVCVVAVGLCVAVGPCAAVRLCAAVWLYGCMAVRYCVFISRARGSTVHAIDPDTLRTACFRAISLCACSPRRSCTSGLRACTRCTRPPSRHPYTATRRRTRSSSETRCVVVNVLVWPCVKTKMATGRSIVTVCSAVRILPFTSGGACAHSCLYPCSAAPRELLFLPPARRA